MRRGFTPLEIASYSGKKEWQNKALRGRKSLTGFTLIELVVYMGILALIGVAAVRLVLSVSFNAAEVRAEQQLSAGGEIALEGLLREIRQARAAALAQSVFGSSPSTLSLETSVSPGGSATTTRTFGLSDSRLFRQDAGGLAEFVTSSGVKVTEFIVWQSATTTSSLITVKIRMEAGQGRFREDKNFYGSAVLRAKY